MRIAALLTLLIGTFGFLGEAASAPTGQPVAYALTPKNTITVIDTGNHEILNTVTLAGPANYIVGTPDGKQLYVMGYDPASINPDPDNTFYVVWVIDTQTYTVTTTIPLNLFPGGMVISSDGARVYAETTFSQSEGEVAVIDTATNVAVARIANTDTSATGIAISPNGQRIYVPMAGGNDDEGALDVIETASNTLTNSPVLAGDSFTRYEWAAVSPDSSKLITDVSYSDSSGNPANEVFVFDTTSNKQLYTAPIGAVFGTPLPNSNILYGMDGGSVVAYNTQTNVVAATIPVAGSISSLALTPNGQQLYVSNNNSQSIAIIDTATNALTGSVAVPGATGMAIVAAPPTLVLTPPVPSLQVSPSSVPPGAPATLAWTSTGATSCTSSGAWTGAVALQGTSSVSFPAAGSQTFTLTCTGPGGSAAASASLTVVSGSTLTASQTDVAAGSTLVLSWKAFAGASACYGTGAWSGDLPLSGSQVVGPLTSAATFTLQCSGPSGQEDVTKAISVFTPGPLNYAALVPPNNNVYALGTPGTADVAGGLDGHGYTFDSRALPNPLTAFGQTFTIGAASKPTGISSQTIALTAAQLDSLTILETAVNGNQLNQPFVVTYSDGTKTTYTQSLTDWGTSASFPGEFTPPIIMSDRLTATGAKQIRQWSIHAFSIPLDGTKVATSLQLPKNRDVIVLAINETKAPQASRESISSAFNVIGLATAGHASTGRLDGHGYAYDASLLPSGFSGAGQQFSIGPADQLDAVSNSTIPLPAKTRLGLTVLATAVNGSQPNQTFVVTYQDGSTSTFQQSVSDWLQSQNYAGELVAHNTAARITPTGARQAADWHIYAYSFQTDPNKQIVSLTLPKNRDVVVFAVNTLTK